MYKEKTGVFECGFSSFLTQNRSQFFVSYFIYGLLYLILDLEIVLIFPYTVSSYVNGAYGLVIMLFFTCVLIVGIIFELGKNALDFSHKQNYNLSESNRGDLIIISYLGAWKEKIN